MSERRAKFFKFVTATAAFSMHNVCYMKNNISYFMYMLGLYVCLQH